MQNKPNIVITMTFRDKKILKFFRERCSNTKFDKAWAVRNIFEDYFDRIKNNPDIAFEIDETALPVKFGMGREKVVIKASIFNHDAIAFLRNIRTKNGRAFFVKNVILLYFYNRKAYDEPEILKGVTLKNTPQAEIKSGVKKDIPLNSDLSNVLDDF